MSTKPAPGNGNALVDVAPPVTNVIVRNTEIAKVPVVSTPKKFYLKENTYFFGATKTIINNRQDTLLCLDYIGGTLNQLAAVTVKIFYENFQSPPGPNPT